MKALGTIVVFLLFILVAVAQKSTGLVFTPSSTTGRTATAMPSYFRNPIPPKLDLSDQLPPVGSQHPQNSCVGWALGYACRSYYIYKDLEEICKDDPYYQESSIISPAFIYNLLNKGKNSGINLHRALQMLLDTGACLMRTMPYDPYDWKKKPNYYQMQEAKKYRIEAFRKVDLQNALINLKAALVGGNPVVCAAYYDQKYFDNGYNTKAPHYLWSTLTSSKQTIGHAIVFVGYDDTLKAFKFMNSWGEKWGNKGYGWISYALVSKAIREAYVIKPRYYYAPSSPHTKPPKHGNPKDQNNPYNPIPNNTIVYDWGHYTPERKDSVTKWAGEIVNKDSTEVLLGIAYEVLVEDTDKPYTRNGIIEVNGIYNIAPEVVGEVYVATPIFFSNKGKPGLPVMSLEEEYQLANGQSAAVSEIGYTNGFADRRSFWDGKVSLSSLKLPPYPDDPAIPIPPTIKLVIVPVLFVDNFPMATGKPYEFEITY